MKSIVFFSVIATFVGISTGEEPPAIPSLDSLSSYHTKVTFTDNSENKRYNYEEFYESISRRGRLSVVSGDDAWNTYYYSNPAQSVTIRDYDQFSNCTVQSVTASEKLYDMIDVDDTGSVVLGPMAVWKKMYRIFSNRAGPDVFKHEYGTIRGVETSIYKLDIQNDEKAIKMNVQLAFMKANWSRFEDVQAQVPVRFLVSGSQGGIPVDHQFDFFLIEEETKDSLMSDLQPTPGIGCPGFQSSPQASFPGSKASVSNQVAFSLEVYDIINDQNQTMIKRHDMAYDEEEMVARFDNYLPDIEEADVYIQDLRRGIVYRTKSGEKCDIGHVSDSVDDKFIGYTHGMRTVRTLRQVLNLDGGNYYNLGQAQRRGITLDVWETIVNVNGTEYDVMFGQPGIQLQRVITHFFSNDTIMENMFRQVLIMSLVTDYTNDGIERQIKSQKELSYFDFRELNFGQTYLDTFSVADCVTDPAERRYFDIFVKHIDDSGSGDSGIDLTKHSAQIRQAARKLVANYARISILRVPQINIIHERNDGIMLNALILEKELSILSFRKRESAEEAKPTLRDDVRKVEGEIECADLALDKPKDAPMYKSFLFCSGTCYLRTYGLDDSEGGIPANETKPCDFYERSLLGTDGQELIAEPDLKEVERLLFEAYADGDLVIKIKEPGQEKEQNLIVSSLLVSRSVEDDVDDREEPFREMSPGFKIKPADTAKVILPRDPSRQMTFGDCYLSCKEQDSMTCQSFSFCDMGNLECVVSSLLIDESSEGDTDNGPIEMDGNCSTYSMSYMHRFQKLEGKVDEISGEVLEKKSKDVQTCARECSIFEGFKCESFAFCGSECVLRKEHMFESQVTTIGPGPDEERKRENVTGKGCTLYHLKYLLDYVVTGIDLVSGEDDILSKQDGIDANTCAAFCSKEIDCKSINFCNLPGSTSCELTMNSPLEASSKTVRNRKCLNYVKKSSLNTEWLGNEVTKSSNGMSGGAFFGVIIAMIITGLILGVVGLLGYNWFQQRETGLGGFGISVKYVRQNNDSLVNNEEKPATSHSTAVPLD